MHYTVIPHGRSAVGWNGVPGRTSLHALGCDCYGCCEGYGASDRSEGETIEYAVGAAYAADVAGVPFPLDKYFDRDAGYFGSDNAVRDAFRVGRTEDAYPKIQKMMEDADLVKVANIAANSVAPLENFLVVAKKYGKFNGEIVDFILGMVPLPEKVEKWLREQSQSQGFETNLNLVLREKKQQLQNALEERAQRAAATAAGQNRQTVSVAVSPASLKSVGGRDAADGPFGLQSSYGGVNTYVLIVLAAAGSYGIYRATRKRT
ncbi:MAG: hypothetical protein P3A33_09835 [Gemmatimonadota bacterium]|jgi:hypothetical protein|nr:hypothetical protein [Gemmatimonadota bacterium]